MMLTPNEYEDLNTCLIILGSDIIRLLKKKKFNGQDLFIELNKQKEVSLEKFHDTLTFLWLVDAIVYGEYTIKLKSLNVLKQTI